MYNVPNRMLLQVLYAWNQPFPPALCMDGKDPKKWYWAQADQRHLRGL